MTKLSYIYLISLALLTYESITAKRSDNYGRDRRSTKVIRTHYHSRSSTVFAHAISTGDKSYIKRKQIEKFKQLNLIHLFTPSGLHFTSIFIFLNPLISLLKRRANKSSILVESMISTLPLLLEGFFSLKRIALLKFVTIIARVSKYEISLFKMFSLVFIIDFFIGSYTKSSLSFIYSFLFLGTIFSKDKHNIKTLILLFLGAQIIISFFQVSTFTYTGFIQGFFITSIFTLLFPLIFIHYWLGVSFLEEFISSVLSCFISFVNFNAAIAQSSGTSYSSIPLIILVILFSFKHKKFLCFTPLLLMIHSNPIYSFPKSAIGKHQASGIDAKWLNQYDSIKRTNRGYKLTYTNGYTCYSSLNDYYYERNCLLKNKL